MRHKQFKERIGKENGEINSNECRADKTTRNEECELQRKREKEFDNQVQSLSKHNVENLYDVRAIAKSRQFKEQQSHYSTEQALSELEDLLQANRLYKFSDETTQFIKKVTGRDYDSYTVRETGKFINSIIDELKAQYEIKE